MRKLIKGFLFLIPTVVITLIIFRTIIFTGYVPSESMEPTFDVKTGIIATRLGTENLHHGDVIIFHPPVKGEEHNAWIKRVIGLPGDVIYFKGESVYRNEKLLDEPYVVHKAKYNEDQVYTVPKGCVFVMGDNRANSYDSRYWKDPYLKEDQILAKPVMVFPLTPSCKTNFEIL